MNPVSQSMQPQPHVHIGGYTHVHAKDILFCEGDSNYSHVHFANGRRVVMVASTLGILEARLADRGFIRVNRSALINPEYIRGYDKYEVELTDGRMVPIARRRRSVVRHQLAVLFTTQVHA